jgi:hypothetical protein
MEYIEAFTYESWGRSSGDEFGLKIQIAMNRPLNDNDKQILRQKGEEI